MLHSSKTHAGAGDLPVLVSTPLTIIRARLDAFLPDASDAQQRAGDEELDVLQAEGARVIALYPEIDEPLILDFSGVKLARAGSSLNCSAASLTGSDATSSSANSTWSG